MVSLRGSLRPRQSERCYRVTNTCLHYNIPLETPPHECGLLHPAKPGFAMTAHCSIDFRFWPQITQISSITRCSKPHSRLTQVSFLKIILRKNLSQFNTNNTNVVNLFNISAPFIKFCEQ